MTRWHTGKGGKTYYVGEDGKARRAPFNNFMSDDTFIVCFAIVVALLLLFAFIFTYTGAG